jgi:hypothetical protein
MNHHEQVVELFLNHFKDSYITGIEIGTAEGCLTKSLLLYLSNLTMIHTIDPFQYRPGEQYEASKNNQEWHDDRRRQAEVALAVYEGRYNLLCVPSDNAVSLTPNNVDFVWIDGDHTESQVRKDILNYYSKVRSGGIFGGHDWNLVIKLVKELITEPVTLGQDWTWWAVKK